MDYPALLLVVRCEFEHHAVTGKYSNSVHSHAAREVSENFLAGGKPYAKKSSGEDFRYQSFFPDDIWVVFGQTVRLRTYE